MQVQHLLKHPQMFGHRLQLWAATAALIRQLHPGSFRTALFIVRTHELSSVTSTVDLRPGRLQSASPTFGAFGQQLTARCSGTRVVKPLSSSGGAGSSGRNDVFHGNEQREIRGFTIQIKEVLQSKWRLSIKILHHSLKCTRGVGVDAGDRKAFPLWQRVLSLILGSQYLPPEASEGVLLSFETVRHRHQVIMVARETCRHTWGVYVSRVKGYFPPDLQSP